MTNVAVANNNKGILMKGSLKPNPTFDDNGGNMIDKYLGSLFGLAIGDALGAPVEFLSLKSINA